MKSKISLMIASIILALVLSACGSSPPVAAKPAPEQSAAFPAPDQVVQAFWDAMLARDLEAALALVAEDVKCRGSCYFTGKTQLRAYLQGYLDAGFETKIRDLQTEGSQVTYSWELHRNGLLTSQGLGQESMQVEGGLIVFWENLRQ